MVNAAERPLWTPSPERVAASNLTAFMAAVRRRHGVKIAGYDDLYRWSIDRPQAFWAALWDFCGIVAEERGDTVVEDFDRMPGARWFPDARLNFAENLLRRRDDGPALIFSDEDGRAAHAEPRELHDEVSRHSPGAGGVGGRPRRPRRRLSAQSCRRPRSPCWRAASLGAIWSSCSPDFGIQGVMDRFGQIAPEGAVRRRRLPLRRQDAGFAGRARAIRGQQLPGLERMVVVPYARPGAADSRRSTPRCGRTPRLLCGPATSTSQGAPSTPPLHPLLLGHHRRAQVHRPRHRRHPAPAPEGAPAALRPQAGRHARLLLHHVRLDDVELAGVGAGVGGHPGAVRRLALPSRRRGAVRSPPTEARINVFGTSAKFIDACDKAGLEPRQQP